MMLGGSPIRVAVPPMLEAITIGRASAASGIPVAPAIAAIIG